MRLRKVLSRFLLVGGVLLLISGIAGAQSLTGGCSGSINGRTAESLTFDDPLVVKKGDSVVVSGTAPAGTSGKSSTRVKVGPLGFGPYSGKSGSWGGTVKVPDVIFNVISGVVKVDATARGSGWTCKGDGYIKIEGDGIGEVIAGALGITVGGAAAQTGKKPGKRKKENKFGREMVNTIKELGREGREMGLPNDLIAWVIFMFLIILYMLIGTGSVIGLLLPLAAVSEADSSAGTVRLSGRPVRGFFGGFFLGLGVFLLLHRFGLVALEWPSLLIPPVGGAVIFLVRALLGEKYVVPAAATTEPPAAPPEPEAAPA